MGENAQKIGKKLEQLGVNLLGMFKWNKKMSDKENKMHSEYTQKC